MRSERQHRRSSDLAPRDSSAGSTSRRRAVKPKQAPARSNRAERDALLVRLGDRERDLVDPRAVMAVACEELGKHLGANRVLYGEIKDDERFEVHQHYSRGVPNVAGSYRFDEVGPALVAEARAGRDLVIVDVKTDPRVRKERPHYESIQTRSGIASPLVKGGRLRAILAVHLREPRQWTRDEIALVHDVADRTWAAVERATTETALRASEERLRLALDVSGMGSFLWHAEGDRIEANERLLELFDVPLDPKPSLAAAMRARVHPEDRARFAEVSARARDPHGTGAYRNEVRVVQGNGDVRWLRYVGQVYFGGDPPRPIRSVGTVADITEQKRTEAKVAAAATRDAFRVALTDAIRSLAAPNEVRLAACHLLRVHLGANRAFYAEVEADDQHLSVDAEEIEGVPSMVGRYAIDDFGKQVLGVGRLGGIVIVNDVQSDERFDTEARALYARLRGAAYVAVPLIKGGRLAGGLVVGQATPRVWTAEEVALVEETGDRTWAAVERAKAEQELREADRRKDEFLAILAHELRNPLAPLRNALEVMTLAAKDGETVQRARDMMARQLAQMVRLIDDLLDVSRINRGKVELRRERALIEQIVEEAVETSRPLIEAGSQRLKIDVPAEAVWVDADRTRLAQVFANLLNNAAKYTEPGGDIRVSAEREGDSVVVRVRDTGIGIPKEMLPRVFEMFWQVDRSLEKAQGGLGVGLSLVKGLVELHGGTVEAHSEGLGRGSEFVVRLPIATAPPDKAEHRARRAPAAAAVHRILVVDDNRDAATSLATLLDALNYETRTAFDGLEAIAIAAEFLPAVVLLDVGMPRMNGYDACRRIRQQPWGKDMVIVALTGWGRDEDKQRSKDAGFDLHLIKPVDPQVLSRMLSTLPASRPA